LKQLNSNESESLLRQNAEYRYVINLLNEFDKPLYSYKPLNGVENLRLVRTLCSDYLVFKINNKFNLIKVTKFYESIVNAKNIINSQIAIKSAPKGNNKIYHIL